MVIGCLKARDRPGERQLPLHAPRGRRTTGLPSSRAAVIYHRSFGAEVRRRAATRQRRPADRGRRRQRRCRELPGAVNLEDALAQGDTGPRHHPVARRRDDGVHRAAPRGGPRACMWRQSDTYVVVDERRRPRVRRRDPRQGAATTGTPWFAVSPLMHAAGHVDGVRGSAQRAARGALRHGRSSTRAPCCETARAGEGRHDDDGRRRVRRPAGRGTATAAPTTCRRCSRSAPGERRPTRNTNGRCWNCCRRSP